LTTTILKLKTSPDLVAAGFEPVLTSFSMSFDAGTKNAAGAHIFYDLFEVLQQAVDVIGGTGRHDAVEGFMDAAQALVAKLGELVVEFLAGIFQR
jgi:hypothetical protein